MGIGPEPKIAIAVMLAIFAIVIDTVLGLRSVDPDMVNLARVGRASKWQILTKIRLPCFAEHVRRAEGGDLASADRGDHR